MDVRVLGTLEVRDDHGRALDLGSPLQRTLLALLLLEPGALRSDDWLVEHLWSDGSAPGSPLGSLQTYVARARRVLRRGDGSAVVARSGNGYRLVLRDDEVDVTRFVVRAARGRSELRAGRPAAAMAAAEDALSLWRTGDPLPELEDREVARIPRERWRELRVGCEEDRLEALVAVGRPEDAVADLDVLTSAHPLRERGWLLLIKALHRCGRTADALERYRRVRDLLDEDLGLEPGPELRELHLSILRGRPHTGAVTVPAQPSPGARHPGSGPAGSAGRGPLIGRDAQRQIVLDTISELWTSGPRYVVIEGEPGIGKTRLAQEATDLAESRGLLTAWGRCHEDASIPALWPWRQVGSALGAGDATAEADDLSRVFERVRDAVVRAAAAAPVVIVLEDAHWADPASLRLLSFLTRELDRAPVAFLVTTRAENLSDQRVRTRADLARTTGFRHLALGPLDSIATTALVATTGVRVPAHELARVCSRSGGNPLFAVELARLYDGGGDPTSLPGGIRDVIRRRLVPLRHDALALLRLGAVLGERVDLHLLLRAADPELTAAADALDDLLAAGLLVADGPTIAFSHAVVRETLLAELSVVERRRLHSQVASAGPVDVFERAHHLVEGRPLTDAAAAEQACREAAERAERNRTYASAAQWWQRALDVAGTSHRPVLPRQRALLGLATALVRSGQSLAGQQTLRECIEEALDGDDVSTAVDAATVLSASQGSWYWVEYGTYPTALMLLLRRTLARLEPDERAARASVLLTMAAGEHYGDTRAAAVLADEAVDEARATGEPGVLAEALAGWLYCTWSADQAEAVVAAATELLTLARGPLDVPGLALHAMVRRAQAHLVLAATAASDADVAAAWDLAEELRLPVYRVQLIQLQGMRAVLAGELELADDLYAQARALHETVEMHISALTDMTSLFLLRVEQGRADELLPAVTDAARHARPETMLLTVAATLQAGDLPAARRLTRQAGVLDPAPRWWNWEAVTCFQAHLAAELDVLDEAERLVEELAPVAGHVAVYGGITALGPVTRHLGRLEATLGRWADAEGHLRSCLEVSGTQGLRPSWADAAVSLAEVLIATGRPEEATGLLAEAERTADELGLAPVAARARAAADGAQRPDETRHR